MDIILNKYDRFHSTMSVILTLNPSVSVKQTNQIAEILNPIPNEIRKLTNEQIIKELKGLRQCKYIKKNTMNTPH